MTYKDVLADLFDLLNRHKMIKTYGYGPLSELVDPKNTELTNYPYAFLQPTNHTFTKGQTAYRFNLIMMEMCDDEHDEIIQAQSNCNQYIKDVLAQLYYHYGEKYDYTYNTQMVPFQEKYDDTVSGMTAQVEIIVRDGLNDCITPFNYGITEVPYLYRTNSVNSIMGEDPFELVNMYFDTPIEVGNGEFNTDYTFIFADNTNIRVEYEYSYSYQSFGSTPYPPLIYQGSNAIEPTKLEGWPTNPVSGVTYNIKAEFEFEAQSGLYYAYRLNNDNVNSRDMYIVAGNSVKIYKTV